MEIAIDRLVDKIKEFNNPIVMGLDPRLEMIPEFIKGKNNNDVYASIMDFNKGLIDSVCDIVPAVKPQIAFYEMFGIEGMRAFKDTCSYAKEKGMIVIADIKRGDIGSTAKGYSEAYIGETAKYDIDFVTVNPYLGIDGIKPFIDDCEKLGKGIFILVKTSNKSSGEIQDLKLETGETVYERVGSLVETWGVELVGKYGYSSVGAVVGATHPEQLKNLREKMSHTFFLIPGYGAQGGKAEDIAFGFNKQGIGGIVNASRSLMYAYKSDMWKDEFSEEDFAKATRAEALKMQQELLDNLTIL